MHDSWSSAFVANCRGAISFEAIWVGLFLVSFFVPTTFLYRYTTNHLEASIAQRTAARNEALNSNCNGSFFIPIPAGLKTDSNSATTIRCTHREGEEGFSVDQKFWQRMDQISSRFTNLVDAQKASGRVHFVEGASDVLSKNVSLGKGGALSALNAAPTFTQSKLLVPSTEYWQFDQDVWAHGHDQAVWSKYSSKHKKLFPDVYPAAN